MTSRRFLLRVAQKKEEKVGLDRVPRVFLTSTGPSTVSSLSQIAAGTSGQVPGVAPVLAEPEALSDRYIRGSL